jgi:hypothetical protein
MRTRDVLRWNLSARDTLAIAGLALAALVLRVLEAAAVRIERWMDAP